VASSPEAGLFRDAPRFDRSPWTLADARYCQIRSEPRLVVSRSACETTCALPVDDGALAVNDGLCANDAERELCISGATRRFWGYNG